MTTDPRDRVIVDGVTYHCSWCHEAATEDAPMLELLDGTLIMDLTRVVDIARSTATEDLPDDD